MQQPDELHSMDTLVDTATIVKLSDTDNSAQLGWVPALIIQSHPLPRRMGEMAWLTQLAKGLPMELARNFPDFASGDNLIGQPLADPYLSRSAITLTPLKNGEIEIDSSQTNTQLLIDGESVKGRQVLTQARLAKGVVLELSQRVCLLLKTLKKLVATDLSQQQMLGISPQLNLVRQQLSRLQGIEDPVLIRGATGVGKELVAQAIVESSKRAKAPFISVNLGAIPESLAAAELFGTQKGAFTGADKNRGGYFQAADGGTLFLDEIGEASPEVQAMLLRVLETGEMFAVGSHTPKKVDVRLIAATDADLEAMSTDKAFKLPLLHRLASYEIRLPGLKDRREDIGLLFLHFARQQLRKLNKTLPNSSVNSSSVWLATDFMGKLLDYDWPGNIRQLRNVVRQLMVDNPDNEQCLPSEHLLKQLNTATVVEPLGGENSQVSPARVKRRKPNSVSKQELMDALESNLWELQAVADSLNISRASVYELMQRFGLRSAGDRSEEEIRSSFERCNGELEQMVFDLKMSKHAIKRRVNELGLLAAKKA